MSEQEQRIALYVEKHMALFAVAKQRNPRRALLVWQAFLRAVDRRSRPLTQGAALVLQRIADGNG